MGGGAHAVHSIEIPLVHVQQRSTWDCGISAVMMVMSEKERRYVQENLNLISEQEGFNQSTWTIDLAYLIHKFNISHLYTTITLGVHPGYSQEDFYEEVLKKDTQRINDKFLSAEANGVKVENRSVAMEEIIEHLGSGNPAIVLVNANLLFCDSCQSNKCLLQILNCCQISLSYQGHYIVLCGFDQKDSKIRYRNPTFLDRVCTIPYDAFENARKSFGTDEDVLFIFLKS